MAIIGKIRDNSALVVAVIGLGLFAFLFMDMKSCGGAPQQNNESVSYKKQNPSLFSSNRETIDQQTYQTVSDKLIKDDLEYTNCTNNTLASLMFGLNAYKIHHSIDGVYDLNIYRGSNVLSITLTAYGEEGNKIEPNIPLIPSFPYVVCAST